MSDQTALEWGMASVKGAATLVIAQAIGWVEVSSFVKAGALACAATIGSYLTKKAINYAEPRIKNKIIKIKNKVKSSKSNKK
ncbi:MAG: hypothetical protein MH137_11175 [Flavobacteriales bacterium]|nr:hypothetical protein [Flavobacteriales bacterium]